MPLKHRVIREVVSGVGNRNMIYVTLYCACDPKRSYMDGSQWKIGREPQKDAADRARKKAEVKFREHIPIR